MLDDQLLIFKALNLIKRGMPKDARNILGLTPEDISDADFLEAMFSLNEGLTLSNLGNLPESLPFFKKASSLISSCKDDKSKFFLITVINLAEGITRVLNGDAHGALPFLDINKDAIERISFLIPDLKKIALNFKAICYSAILRANLNAGNLKSALIAKGNANEQYRELLNILDESNPNDIPLFVEIYGTRIESACLFAFMSLQTLNYDEMNKILNSVKEDFTTFNKFILKSKPGTIQNIAKIISITYLVLRNIYCVSKTILLERSIINNEILNISSNISKGLFEAKELALKCGERGNALLNSIEILDKTINNLLLIGKIGKKDFGRFAGIISFTLLFILLLVINLTIKPSGYLSLIYFFGALIISLIGGFGYGALHFRPLLKLYSEQLRLGKDSKTN